MSVSLKVERCSRLGSGTIANGEHKSNGQLMSHIFALYINIGVQIENREMEILT